MDLTRALHAYRTLDPIGWVSAYQVLPPWAGLLMMGVAVALLLAGGGKLFRVVAGPIGALAGLLWAAPIASRLGAVGSPNTFSVAAAVALGVLGSAVPASAVFFTFGVPGGLLAGELAGPDDWLLGFLPGFFVVGAFAAMFTRYIGTVAASAVGAWLFVLGTLSAVHGLGGLAALAVHQPYGVLGAALILAVAGSVYQLVVKPTPEEVERIKAEKARQKLAKEQKKAVEKRWASYSEKRKK
ncbi:MAG: hypothetical protein ACOZIN_13740 [Myxococcota bacterium]